MRKIHAIKVRTWETRAAYGTACADRCSQSAAMPPARALVLLANVTSACKAQCLMRRDARRPCAPPQAHMHTEANSARSPSHRSRARTPDGARCRTVVQACTAAWPRWSQLCQAMAAQAKSARNKRRFSQLRLAGWIRGRRNNLVVLSDTLVQRHAKRAPELYRIRRHSNQEQQQTQENCRA